MFGYASSQTEELMPMPIALAHRIINRLTDAPPARCRRLASPRSKSQVTVEYADGAPGRVTTVVVSTQHAESVSQEEIAEFIRREVGFARRAR
ncbi:MAG: hypothetical protein CM1200mP2_44090 [Planctomycetaceae bacterium]|nr:MAG: hypothetical protein CM1200mP2_44090 [Planctomycetaceae bacterium]